MNLQAYRAEKHLTQQQVANALSVDRAHYSAIERGKKRLTEWQVALLHDVYGWELEPGVNATAGVKRGRPRGDGCRKKKMEPPTLHGERQGGAPLAGVGWLVYEMGLMAYRGEVPQDWRNVRKHSELARKAIKVTTTQLAKRGVWINA